MDESLETGKHQGGRFSWRYRFSHRPLESARMGLPEAPAICYDSTLKVKEGVSIAVSSLQNNNRGWPDVL